MSAPVLLEAKGVFRTFVQRRGWLGSAASVRAVDGVDLVVHQAETLAIVGESGSGKSTLGRLLLGLLRPSAGEVLYDGEALFDLSPAALRRRRRDLQLIFQDPYGSLNPRMTAGALIEEPLWVHGMGNRQERHERVAMLLEKVGLSSGHAGRYPHEFSGGQRQRIGIARALACAPKLVVGDEPVSALDVSIQAQVISLLEDLKADFQLTLVIIAHDLAVVRHMSDRIAVMYLGQIVEIAPNDAFFERPLHPYSLALLAAIPVPDPALRRRTLPLEDDPPNPLAPPFGCRFHPRCAYARERCAIEPPVLQNINGRQVACHFWQEIPQAAPYSSGATHDSGMVRARRIALYRAAQERRPARPADDKSTA